MPAGEKVPGRVLSTLLAGRPKKQKCNLKNEQKLQEAALHILSCHQNLGDLLLEVGSSVWNKPLCSISSSTHGTEAPVPELFVVSALQDQASTLGMPVGILSARIAASNIEKISAESDQAVLLNAEQRKKLLCLLQTLKDLLTHNGFCRLLFAQEMWKLQSPLILEVAWHLQRENIVSLEELLENNPDASALEEWLCGSLCCLCHQTEDPSLDTETLGCILTDFVTVLLRNGFQKTFVLGKKLELQKISKICCAVLDRMLAWVLDAVAKEKQKDASALKAVKCWLRVFGVAAYQGTVPPESLQPFISHTLTQVLTYNPQLKVSDAINLQRDWSFARTSSVLTMLFRKLFLVFKAEELIRHLQQVLETSEVNWHHVLSCVSTLLVCHPEAERLIKDLLDHLLRKAFENYDLENMVTAFLIVRQAALEGPAMFMPYSKWFKVAFGSASGFHYSSKKALVFLFKFLSELVPFEAPQYLKVHVMHPPFVPPKYRPFLLEYITLAKTRLADFKIAMEDMGLYEDLSSMKEAVQPPCQALQDVEKAIQIFENTGKIPTSVMEASIFRRSYYTSRFIPALLVPRVLPQTPDSRMALIDDLKRADKIPLNTFTRYIEECKAVKEKLLQDEATEMETSHLKEPLELLKAELEALRLLITDQSRHDEVPAQIAVVSEKLVGVLGRVKDEDEAASLSLRIKLNLSNPEVEQQDQGAVDLLMMMFCQSVMAASYYLPPERQGAWPSLFVKMVCGHRRLLPSLLGRLCQLMYHQGPSLSSAQVIGLAVFVVHLNEAKSLIPEVDLCTWPPRSASAGSLSVTELWDHLLVCRTGESVVFCMRFCAAALSYSFCKFSSFSHDCLCSLLHPGFVKKLQYVVPRLSLEARGIDCEGEPAELPWKTLSRPAFCFRKAALCLWKQAQFKALLQEKAFQLTLREWLLMELGVRPDEDVLSPCERHEFHYWALYQHFLPMSAAAGGCDGDLKEMCAVLIGTILDFCQRSEFDKCTHLKNPKCSMTHGRGSPDVYCRLQEMLLELELGRRRAPLDVCSRGGHFLFRVLQERLKALGHGSVVGERLLWQQELLLQTRILLGLPPSVLIATQQRGKKITLDCEDFFCFANTELRNICSRGCALSYDITAHFFRGLLSASLECDKPAQEVTAVLTLCPARCPIIICSAARWWQRLEPMLCSEWNRLFGTPLAQGLQSLRELQSSVSSFLSSEAVSLVSDIPWIPAAFLHFAVQQQMVHRKMNEGLKKLGPGSEQLLVNLFFFSLVDFISTRVAPQEGKDAYKALDWSSKMLQLLQEQGASWLTVFCSAGKDHSPCQIPRGAVSDQHLRLLPVAFYSLIVTFEPEHFIGQQTFLYAAIDMYAQLLLLFVDGARVVGPSQHTRELDSLELIKRARQFLLHAIPQCPRGSFSSLQQLVDLCGELDPEMKAALVNASDYGDLLDEELLLF
ncbi:Fanconi anemia group A protein isoform X2 [Rhineura floridana]|uniref:Fanconi anemia group A protein isoform X2 n=1 Tax=Rhineura floridana TaxID=261503 RepID=UPI002AC80362|nr:Fanconi anemia group A protein isoform X2 [Rhineura floridana]